MKLVKDNENISKFDHGRRRPLYDSYNSLPNCQILVKTSKGNILIRIIYEFIFNMVYDSIAILYTLLTFSTFFY